MGTLSGLSVLIQFYWVWELLVVCINTVLVRMGTLGGLSVLIQFYCVWELLVVCLY